MTHQQRKMSDIMKEMSERLLRNPDGAHSSEAAHIALMFANIAWNNAVGLGQPTKKYRRAWEEIEAENPEMWSEFKSNDVDSMIDDLIQFKMRHYPNGQRRILMCGIPDNKIRVEWLPPVAPGVDSMWEMRLYGLVRTGEQKEAIQFLKETRHMSHAEALNETKLIATKLGLVSDLKVANATKKSARSNRKSTTIGTTGDVQTVFEEIVDLVDAFCREHLNDEYAVLCRKLTERLARKRPSPLVKGKPATWASGIVRTIGWVNFLYDKTQTPYMRLSDIDSAFGISESSGATKLAAIRKMLKITPLNYEWTLPSRMGDNPLIWLLEVNGLVMDIRQAPREAQEIAFNNGLIPYIPADRNE